MKILKKIAVILLLVLVAMQFYRPVKNSSQENHVAQFIAETNPSKEVQGVLQNACYDCHSNNTDYPWYSMIAPVSYWLADHVEEGKEELNFSAWESYSDKRKSHKLEEVVEVIEAGEMPLKSYTWVHSEAILTKAQKEAVMAWANQSKVLYQLNRQPQ
ncbi:heme-binding domain-containing protein [Maribacter polysaccharolyticus]|uniref:heme-binding domain-containing protein n=1 Tax=Maribacter polysaccharolyticus TaxID=3020831 RepID=UPI00237F42D2|nr:heme-binding domain-containing protein [Maribacter polysaccharolyticus]MDE3740719.1 heme-binding domain-containing protein [Maribacter polysaccharolyticus]